MLAAGGDDTAARAALATLCRRYWYPLYAFLRRSGSAPHDAEDLTQGFFEHLLSKGGLRTVVRGKGAFRSFLLTSLKNFVSHARDRAHAQKRGGGARLLERDALDAEGRYRSEPADTVSPDQLFDRRWALTVLDRALVRVEEEYQSLSKSAQFEMLRPVLTSGSTTASYAQLSASCGMSEGALKVAVHRLRQRYRDALRAEIAETVASGTQVNGELKQLLAALGT